VVGQEGGAGGWARQCQRLGEVAPMVGRGSDNRARRRRLQPGKAVVAAVWAVVAKDGWWRCGGGVDPKTRSGARRRSKNAVEHLAVSEPSYIRLRR
jgi:hypothetical protein